MISKDELIEQYHRELINIYKEKKLKCLRGIRNEYEIDGKNILTWRVEATKPFSPHFSQDFNLGQ